MGSDVRPPGLTVTWVGSVTSFSPFLNQSVCSCRAEEENLISQVTQITMLDAPRTDDALLPTRILTAGPFLGELLERETAKSTGQRIGASTVGQILKGR